MTTQNRREFLTLLGAAAVGAASGCTVAAAPRRRLNRIGIQLYTVRDQMQADLPGTIARVAAAGYKEVEFAGYYGRTAAQIRDLLAQNSLTSPATHVPIQMLRGDWQKTLDFAREVGHQWVVIPWLEEKERGNLDSWKRIAAELNAGGRTARDAGLRIGYHNHDFELQPIPGSPPSIPLEVLITETDPALVDFELDLYWLTKGGADAVSYFNRFGKRFPLVHVKDSRGAPEHVMTEVGAGSIDFRRIFAAGDKGGIRHYFIEHDNPANPLESIRTSYNNLSALQY